MRLEIMLINPRRNVYEKRTAFVFPQERLIINDAFEQDPSLNNASEPTFPVPRRIGKDFLANIMKHDYHVPLKKEKKLHQRRRLQFY